MLVRLCSLGVISSIHLCRGIEVNRNRHRPIARLAAMPPLRMSGFRGFIDNLTFFQDFGSLPSVDIGGMQELDPGMIVLIAIPVHESCDPSA